MDLVAFPVGVVFGAVACACAIYLTLIGPLKADLDACKRQHNVYECAAIYIPVTPDGQPLDMSDPFHGEDE